MASVTVTVFVIHKPLKPGISLCSVIVLLGQLNNKSCSKSEEIHMCCQVSRSFYNFNSSILYSSYFLYTIILTAVAVTILLFEVAMIKTKSFQLGYENL